LGMGWVSIFEPEALAQLLKLPLGASPVAILCLGHVNEFYPEPMLQMENWRQGIELDAILYENQWDEPAKL
jgi:5,6-dimethylbenzimidazole synthase